MTTAYRCSHTRITSSHTNLLTRSGRQVELLIDDAGNARQYRDHPDGYRVASRRIDQEVAEILQEAEWHVEPLEEGEGSDDEIAMITGGDGSLGMAFKARGVLDGDTRIMARIDALALRLGEMQVVVEALRKNMATINERIANPPTTAPTVPEYDDQSFQGVFPDTEPEGRVAPQAPPPMPRQKRGRFGSRGGDAAEAEEATLAGAGVKNEALAGIGQG